MLEQSLRPVISRNRSGPLSRAPPPPSHTWQVPAESSLLQAKYVQLLSPPHHLMSSESHLLVCVPLKALHPEQNTRMCCYPVSLEWAKTIDSSSGHRLCGRRWGAALSDRLILMTYAEFCSLRVGSVVRLPRFKLWLPHLFSDFTQHS